MSTYKIGNKINCTIRSYSPCEIGDVVMRYGNQPYTVIKDVEADLTFDLYTKEGNAIHTVFDYENGTLDKVELSNVLITNKIMNLIYSKSEWLLCSANIKRESDETKKIYLNLPTDTIYQVFVYDDNGELESAYDSLESGILTVEKENSSYTIFYNFEGSKSYSFDSNNNLYLTLDLELLGNKDDETQTSWIHIEKCCLVPSRSLYFSRNLNTTNLIFKVIENDFNYIVLE